MGFEFVNIDKLSKIEPNTIIEPNIKESNIEIMAKHSKQFIFVKVDRQQTFTIGRLIKIQKT